MTRRGSVAGAALVLVTLTAGSQVLGLLRDAAIAAVFGVGSTLDAYLVAQGVMNLVLALVAGAMARAVVPVVSRAADADDLERASRTVQTALTVTSAVLVAGSVLVYLTADTVVALLAPGFDSDAADLTVSLTRIILVAAVFVAGTNVLAAAAQSHGRYFLSGLEGVVFNLVMITAALGFGAAYGVSSLAVGFVVGSAARFVTQLPAVRAAGLRLRPRLGLRDADFREVLRLVPALLLGSAVANVNTLVDRAVGSEQGAGTITALSLGWRVVTLVDTLLVATVAAALFPAFSRLGTSNRRAELRALVDRSLAVVLVLLAPASAALAVASGPAVQLIFGRGDFDADAVRLTATAVTYYAFGAVGIALRSLSSRAFLAVGDSRTPVTIAVVAMVVNVVGDLTLGVAYGIPGLAGSTSLSLAVAAVLSVVVLARKHGALTPRPLAAAAGRVLVASTLAAASGLLASSQLLEPLGSGAGGSGQALTSLAGTAAVVGLVYVAVLAVLGSPELRTVAVLLLDRLPTRIRRRR